MKFPCLLINESDGFSKRLSNLNFFDETSYRSLRRKYWHRCRIYDSNFFEFTIDCECEESYFAIFLKSIKREKNKFKFEFIEYKEVTLEHLKLVLISSILKCGDLYPNPDISIRLVREAKDFEQLLNHALPDI